ncbi:MAG: amidohydrolase [Candidatus Krumholzibacteriales bacterium]
MVNKGINKQLMSLRRELHSSPELSWDEHRTSERIINFISGFSPDQVITGIAGTGLAAVFEGSREGPTVLIRSELDALPIAEINSFDYRSESKGVSHKCGHDGHMAIVAGMAHVLSESRPERGRAVLLFQPAEETGEGAARVISDGKFELIKPDYVFAAHNLPGHELNSVVIGYDNFASASRGMVIRLTGKTSHAAEPSRGLSPAMAMSNIIRELTVIDSGGEGYRDFILSTVVHARLGEVALGTSPGEAEVIATLRAVRDDDMELLAGAASETAERIAAESGLDIDINWIQEFPSTVNNRSCSELVAEAAEKEGYETRFIDKPFRWSEDFGHFTGKFPGALFGIGAGTGHPSLHNPDYDFPDQLLETGIKVFSFIIYNLLGKGEA